MAKRSKNEKFIDRYARWIQSEERLETFDEIVYRMGWSNVVSLMRIAREIDNPTYLPDPDKVSAELEPISSLDDDGKTKLIGDLVDTVEACLRAAGASEDFDEMERQVVAAGTKPSHFIKRQFEEKNLRIVELEEECRSRSEAMELLEDLCVEIELENIEDVQQYDARIANLLGEWAWALGLVEESMDRERCLIDLLEHMPIP